MTTLRDRITIVNKNIPIRSNTHAQQRHRWTDTYTQTIATHTDTYAHIQTHALSYTRKFLDKIDAITVSDTCFTLSHCKRRAHTCTHVCF